MRSVRIALAGLVVAAATLVGLAAPAQAAACQRGTGVTVVVQGQGFNSTRCDAGGAGTASGNFGAVGHSLTRVSSQPGFVCKVDSRPSVNCQNTPPTDAYWGLYWANGKGGGWSYSNSGVGSLRVPKGGWVAFVFQDGGRRSPSVTPLGPAPAPKPKPKPTAAKPTATAAKPVTPKPSATASAKPKAKPSSTPSAEATAAAASSSDQSIKPTASTTDDSSPALLWVAGGLAIVLIVAGVVVARARATRS